VLAIGRILIATAHEVAGLMGSGYCDKPAVAGDAVKRSGRCSTNRISVRARRSWLKGSPGLIHDLNPPDHCSCMSKSGYRDGSILFKIWRNHVGYRHRLRRQNTTAVAASERANLKIDADITMGLLPSNRRGLD
jgi:hypothetical protein